MYSFHKCINLAHMHQIKLSAYIYCKLSNIIGKTMKKQICICAFHIKSTGNITSNIGIEITLLSASNATGGLE